MLVGFFKKDEEKACKCQIVKYSDRIWFDEKGTAYFLRNFVVRVSPDSPIPLTELKLLLPAEHVLDIKSRNDSYSNEQYYFNQPHIRTTNSYKIKKNPESNVYNAYGLIDDDGIENIKIFTSGEYAPPRSFRFGKGTILRFKFPDAVNPGEATGSRFSFKIASLFDNVTASEIFPEYNFSLLYFSQKYNEEIQMLGSQTEIDVIPTLKGDNHPGGFDIWVYLPPNFMKVTGFDGATEKIDHRTINGEESNPRLKYGWKLRWLLRNYGYPEDTPMNSNTKLGLSLDIGGIIKQRYDDQDALKKLCDTAIPSLDGTVRKMKKEVRLSTILAIIAIILAILAILVPLGIELLKRYF